MDGMGYDMDIEFSQIADCKRYLIDMPKSPEFQCRPYHLQHAQKASTGGDLSQGCRDLPLKMTPKPLGSTGLVHLPTLSVRKYTSPMDP